MAYTTIAKSILIPISFLLAGYGTSSSQNTLPMLYSQSPAVSTSIFKGVYYSGFSVIVPGALMSTAAASYLAYVLPTQRTLYVTAAVATATAQIYTGIFMLGGIQQLLAIESSEPATKEKAGESGEVVNLLRTWNMQNWFRVSLYFSAGMISLFASQHDAAWLS
jgi:hypothetical protein